ncbi:integrase catalytic domain-containing protein, partial [Mycobacterium kansasii]
TKVESHDKKRYFLVVVDDYTRFTWVTFLREKSDAFEEFVILAKRLQNEKGYGINRIRSDHGGEFENERFEKYCNEK